MKTRFLITGIMAIMLVVISVTNAEAHRWGRRVCRPARIVVIPAPRVHIVPHVRVVRPYHGRGYAHQPRGYRHHYHRKNHWR